ncbi:MAG: AMP-binding protein [Pikeienuella sp.]
MRQCGNGPVFDELAPAKDWASLRSGFKWRPAARFNIAEMICERWANFAPDRVALIDLDASGTAQEWTFRDLSRRSSQLANVLTAHGIKRGDRVAVLLPQSAETLLTHLATYKIGAILVPLFTLFGEDGLKYRLADSGAKALVTDRENFPKIAAISDEAPDLATTLVVGGGFHRALAGARDTFECAVTGPEDPALISYTSGTTGAPKGVLHGHKVLAAHAIGARVAYDFLPHAGDLMWTPADWAWLGGSMNAMGPSLYHGVPLLAYRMARFDPEEAFAIMARRNVRLSFLPPTAMKLMKAVQQPGRHGHNLRAVGSAGEAMGADLLEWGKGALGLTINEFYGQTECNMVIGNNAAIAQPEPGSMGRAMPGHHATILQADGAEAPCGEAGELAIRSDDPGMFLRYWNKPTQTAEKFVNGWMLTGDVAERDEMGRFRFSSRTDDVITSSGYRIGPTEIEDCLASHPAVAVAAVVGAPDPVRTEVICAFVKATPGATQSDETAAALIAHVRTRLSPHMSPARVEFVDDIPMTATGKIMRRELRALL